MNHVLALSAVSHLAWEILILTVCSAFTMLILYGLYFAIFIFSLYALARRTPPGRWVMFVAVSMMFLLGTLATAITVAEAVIALRTYQAVVQSSIAEVRRLQRVNVALGATELVRLAINSVVVDLFLLYRCYVIWGSNKKVVVVPTVLIFIPSILVLVSIIRLLLGAAPSSVQADIDIRTPFLIMLGGNILLMLLTGDCYLQCCGFLLRKFPQTP
ncbi:hypothetical protein B0H14DRAFT_1471202 [Mycena olivaceomarginata]|nr:hypothetical protein B0H14DRAFT_1471202 [Mycena olivaceomarginata]